MCVGSKMKLGEPPPRVPPRLALLSKLAHAWASASPRLARLSRRFVTYLWSTAWDTTRTTVLGGCSWASAMALAVGGRAVPETGCRMCVLRLCPRRECGVGRAAPPLAHASGEVGTWRTSRENFVRAPLAQMSYPLISTTCDECPPPLTFQ